MDDDTQDKVSKYGIFKSQLPIYETKHGSRHGVQDHDTDTTTRFSGHTFAADGRCAAAKKIAERRIAIE